MAGVFQVLDEPHSSWLAWGVSMFMRLTVVLSLAVTQLGWELVPITRGVLFLGVPIIRIMYSILGSICWGPLILGNYHIFLQQEGFRVYRLLPLNAQHAPPPPPPHH